MSPQIRYAVAYDSNGLVCLMSVDAVGPYPASDWSQALFYPSLDMAEAALSRMRQAYRSFGVRPLILQVVKVTLTMEKLT